MLQRPSRTYSVSHSYAVFTAILCWVVQRVRSPLDGSSIAEASAALWQELTNERVEDEPWSLWTNGTLRLPRSLGPYPGLEHLAITSFLTALRDAVAHGDGRRIRPVNRHARLVGHEFLLDIGRGAQKRTVAVQLNRTMMRRIGGALAQRFCAALANVDPALGAAMPEHANALREEDAY
jgi:hypothetical protein